MELVKVYFFKPGKKEETKNREAFNIRHFIKKIKRDGCYGDFKIPEDKINQWLTELDRHDQVIINLMEQRDNCTLMKTGTVRT